MMTAKMLAMAGLSASVFAIAAAPANAAVNLLSDPSFETGLSAAGGDVHTTATTPWKSWNNWAGPQYTGFYTQATAYAGVQAGKTYSGPNCGIYQSVNITPGTTYAASAYFEILSGDPLTAGAAQTVDLRVTYFDAANNAVGAAFVSPTKLTGLSPKDVWTQLSVTSVAPAGASRMEVLGFMDNPNNGGGSFFMDAASLTATPEPASLAALALAGTGLLGRRRARFA